MPCTRMSWSWMASTAATMSATLCDLCIASSAAWSTDSRPSPSVSQPQSRMSSSSSGSRTTSVRTCDCHGITRPFAIIVRSRSLRRVRSAAKLSS